MGSRGDADADPAHAGRGPGPGGAGAGGAAALAGGVLLIGAVLAGNSLMCLSVAAERALRTPTNYFIVSLAAADLLLALLVLPLFVYSEVQGGVWPLSPRLCDALLAMAVLLCTASIFNLCAISADRFVAVALPLRYSGQSGGGRPLLLIGATWLLAAAVATPVLCGLNDVRGRDPAACRLEDRDYVVFSSVCSFFLPCPLMLLLYGATFRGLRRWGAKGAKLHGRALRGPRAPPCRAWRAKFPGRERKAMRVLPLVVGAFLLCWTPFFVVHITRALCPACAVPPGLVSAVTWLGYTNSTLNPVVYAVCNAEFRRVFRKAWRLCCVSTMSVRRAEGPDRPKAGILDRVALRALPHPGSCLRPQPGSLRTLRLEQPGPPVWVAHRLQVPPARDPARPRPKPLGPGPRPTARPAPAVSLPGRAEGPSTSGTPECVTVLCGGPTPRASCCFLPAASPALACPLRVATAPASCWAACPAPTPTRGLPGGIRVRGQTGRHPPAGWPGRGHQAGLAVRQEARLRQSRLPTGHSGAKMHLGGQ